MIEKCSIKFDLFELDMLGDGEGGWAENNRYRLGVVAVEGTSSEEITADNVIKSVAGVMIEDMLGRKFPALTTTNKGLIYAEDYYGDGSWWEVGTAKQHEPFYGLALIEESAKEYVGSTDALEGLNAKYLADVPGDFDLE